MSCRIPLLTSLTIFLLLGKNCDLFTLRKVKEEQHRLLSDYICKIYIIYLEFGKTEITVSRFLQNNFTHYLVLLCVS